MFDFISDNPNKIFEYLKILCTASKEVILVCEKIKQDIQDLVDKKELENTEKNLERIKDYCKAHKNSRSCQKLKTLAQKAKILKNETNVSMDIDESISVLQK